RARVPRRQRRQPSPAARPPQRARHLLSRFRVSALRRAFHLGRGRRRELSAARRRDDRRRFSRGGGSATAEPCMRPPSVRHALPHALAIAPPPAVSASPSPAPASPPPPPPITEGPGAFKA